MAWRVARMTRAKSGSFKTRKAIPKDVVSRADYQTLYGIRREALFRAPPDCTPQQAKAQHAAWLEEIESRIATLRAKQRGEGHDRAEERAATIAKINV
jgi:hypothetical protein